MAKHAILCDSRYVGRKTAREGIRQTIFGEKIVYRAISLQ